MCSAMPLSDTAEIILTSKLVELLDDKELESIIAHEVAHFYYQHALYPEASKSKNRIEFLNLLNFSIIKFTNADGHSESPFDYELFTSNVDNHTLKISTYTSSTEEMYSGEGGKILDISFDIIVF